MIPICCQKVFFHHSEMDLRDTEKYVVKHAKTEPYKNSAIPFMQRLLNENNQNHYK